MLPVREPLDVLETETINVTCVVIDHIGRVRHCEQPVKCTIN